MKLVGWLAAAALLAPAPGAWKAEVQPNGLRRAEVAGEARLGEIRTTAKLALKCRPGVKGSLAWSLQVEHAKKLEAFRFDDFEGPDALALKQELSELAIEGGLMHPQVRAEQSGYFSGDKADSFVLEVTAEAYAASEPALLADAIGPGALGVSWTVTSPRDVKTRLVARFPAQDAAEAVRATMSGCGPAPEITEAMARKWTGKDPNETNILEDRAVDWRLRGLLGADYDAFRAALAEAEPVGVDGGMVYLLGRGEDGSTAAWYADRKIPGMGEAVLVRAQKTQRYFDEDAARLPAPGAVREFIAEAK